MWPAHFNAGNGILTGTLFRDQHLLYAERVLSAAHVRLADANEVGTIWKSLKSPRRFFAAHSTNKPSVN